MSFNNSIQKLSENKKIIKYFLIFFIVFGLFLDTTFAATFQEIKDTTTTVGNGLLMGISMILALFTYLSTMFLSPEWINGSIFGLNSYFKEIWILVSNLVYFIFAFVLIWIAFMNIIGRNADQYQLKQALPKFIVGVLIVPFSWFLVQFILSISAILTVASLSLPFDTFDTFSKTLENVNIPKVCTLDLTSYLDKQTNGAASPKDNGYFFCEKENTMSITEIAGKGDSIDSIFGVIAMYSYGILGLDKVDGLDSIDLKTVQTMGDLVVKIVFDLLFVVIYSVLMIAIGLVLMIRGIYIWIYIMISPVFGLLYFFGKKDGGGDGFFSKFTVKGFIELAMVPVYTMLALSFGLLFLYIVGSGMSGTSSMSGNVKVTDKSIDVGQFKLNIEGSVSKLDSGVSLAKNIGGEGLGIVGSLILKVFGIVILWGAIVAALRTSDITKSITEPLSQFGAQVGKIMTSAPGNIPLFGGQSMNSMNAAVSDVSSHISTSQNTKGRQLSGKFINGNELDNEYGKVLDRNPSNYDQAVGNVKELQKIGNFKEFADNTNGQKALVKNLERILADKKFINNDKAKELIEEIQKSPGDENILRRNLSELNNISPIGIKIFTGRDTIPYTDVDKMFGKIKLKSDEPIEGNNTSSTTQATTGTTQNIKVNINNNKISSMSGIDGLTETQTTDLQKLDVTSFTKQQFIDELNNKININETEANKIAEAIGDKFKQE